MYDERRPGIAMLSDVLTSGQINARVVPSFFALLQAPDLGQQSAATEQLQGHITSLVLAADEHVGFSSLCFETRFLRRRADRNCSQALTFSARP